MYIYSVSESDSQGPALKKDSARSLVSRFTDVKKEEQGLYVVAIDLLQIIRIYITELLLPILRSPRSDICIIIYFFSTQYIELKT